MVTPIESGPTSVVCISGRPNQDRPNVPARTLGPSGEGHAQAVARAKVRYEQLLRSVALGMAGDAQVALDELTGRMQ